jgi:hypothetical protein
MFWFSMSFPFPRLTPGGSVRRCFIQGEPEKAWEQASDNLITITESFPRLKSIGFHPAGRRRMGYLSIF